MLRFYLLRISVSNTFKIARLWHSNICFRLCLYRHHFCKLNAHSPKFTCTQTHTHIRFIGIQVWCTRRCVVAFCFIRRMMAIAKLWTTPHLQWAFEHYFQMQSMFVFHYRIYQFISNNEEKKEHNGISIGNVIGKTNKKNPYGAAHKHTLATTWHRFVVHFFVVVVNDH